MGLTARTLRVISIMIISRDLIQAFNTGPITQLLKFALKRYRTHGVGIVFLMNGAITLSTCGRKL
jgi:hypothetical protein